MITLEQVLFTIGRHKAALASSRKPGADASADEMRWAFLVTPEEVASLVDEAITSNYLSDLSPEHAQHIKDCRALLYLEGVAIMPELFIPELGEKLNG